MFYNLVQEHQTWLEENGLFSALQVFLRLEFRAFFAVIFSFLMVLAFGKRTVRWLVKQKIGDVSEFGHDDLNELMAGKSQTPTMGGVLICASILFTVVLLADVIHNRYVHIALIVLVWLAMLGGIDDWLKLTAARRMPGSRQGLYAWEKLLFQLGVGFIAGYFLHRYGIGQEGILRDTTHALNLPFQRTYKPGTSELETGVIILGGGAFVFITMIFISGTSNAVNLTDGMDGLASGCLVVASLALMVLCFIAGTSDSAFTLLVPFVQDADEMTVIAGAMAGACLGFLWFNCAPAQMFMGDTGSLPLGGLMAYIAVAVRQEVMLLVIGGVFFMEMTSVIMQVGYFKATGGKRIFRCSPIHHHFHLGGWSEQQVVTRFWVLGAIFAMIALVSLKLR